MSEEPRERHRERRFVFFETCSKTAENGHELGSCGVTTGVPGTGLRGRPARDSLTLSLSLHVRSLCMCQAGGETAVSLGPQEEAPNKTWYWALQSPRWVRSWQGGPGRRADSQERATHRPVQALPSPLHSALSKRLAPKKKSSQNFSWKSDDPTIRYLSPLARAFSQRLGVSVGVYCEMVLIVTRRGRRSSNVEENGREKTGSM